ncbi:MAG: tRNA uridine(34) 5-carboxymethylaminomethyl modification radical SAM/GNAT enzyme Elp3 [Candidatus Gracilibacteria bacterium]|nr:tRNA uridine(34) 5-carboxymethylaminomethyl modification radical SAM/GNAT enzyme Elp3 [Candidatus Gracilibacteria bacterium]
MINKLEIIDKIIFAGLQEQDLTKDRLHKIKNEIYKTYKLQKPIATIEIIQRYNNLVRDGIIDDNNPFRKVIRKRGVRSLSGVTVISLLTKEFFCPGKCIYCPTFENLPKSYIPNEPAVQRAELNDFDPILQIHNRLRALEITGHKIEKNDVRIIGGTWSVYPKNYKDEFIKGIYDAFNTYDEMKDFIETTDLSTDKFASFKLKAGYGLKKSKSLEEAKKLNETSRCRIIGIAIETRPDWITPEEIFELRRYGITRVEIGYQTTIDEINILNKRGHGNSESINATKLLKNAGFKVVAHMMPNLLGSTPELDRKSLREVFENPLFRPDELKIYPMVVTDKSQLTDIWKNGGFQPYDDKTLINLTADLEEMIPEYVRLNRTYRDIPASEILAGSHLSNLRQLVEEKLQKKGVKLVDIRHREIKDKKNVASEAKLNIYEYEASDGKEYFLTFEDNLDRTIFSLLRLRLPKKDENNEIYSLLPELKNSALIREIHTFGDQLSIGERGSLFGQHLGFGKKLIEKAQEIAKENGYEKIAVIAGVGVRGYYEKRGYELDGEYMIKNLTK